MRFVAHALSSSPPPLVPARTEREWMTRTDQRFAYRCIPLSFANASGWEVLSPVRFAATWDGGTTKAAVQLEPLDGDPALLRLATSHFGHGILTFHTDYLFRTEPGWGTLVRGAPNWPKDGMVALEGLVETDWLPFPFTMNWIFTRPGRVVFEKDEPIAFVTPVPHILLETITPEIVPISSDPELEADYRAWSEARFNFNAALAKGDPVARKKGWQRHYVRGETPTGGTALDTHRSKRRLKTPVQATSAPPLVPSLDLFGWADAEAEAGSDA
ncbi:MAG: DUF6065 family protein [Alphaproteobacteria bacterium]